MCLCRGEPEVLTCYAKHISRLPADHCTAFPQLHRQGEPCLWLIFPVQGGLRSSGPKALVSNNQKKTPKRRNSVLSHLVTSRSLEDFYFGGHQCSGPEKAHQLGEKCYHRYCTEIWFCKASPANHTSVTHETCENIQTLSPASHWSLVSLQPSRVVSSHVHSMMLVTCSSLKGRGKTKSYHWGIALLSECT